MAGTHSHKISVPSNHNTSVSKVLVLTLYLQKAQKSAHYEVPSLSSMLYEFTNKEQDAIVNAFRVGNWNTLRDLPNAIAPNNVL